MLVVLFKDWPMGRESISIGMEISKDSSPYTRGILARGGVRGEA
jgi:hypothetical protein